MSRFALILALLVAAVIALWFDVTIAGSVSLENVPGDVRRILALSEFFAHGFGVLVVVLTLWTLAPRMRKFVPRLLACALVPGSVVNAIKISVGRYRPGSTPEEIGDWSQSWIGLWPMSRAEEIDFGYAIQSFPSGHTATAFGLAIGLAWLFPRGRMLFFAFATLAASQRVVFGAHWLSDVLVGCAIAVAVAGWITKSGSIADRAFCNWERRRTQAALKSGDDVQQAA